MSLQQFQRCEYCNKGQLLAPDICCLMPECQRREALDMLEKALELEEINEGEYLIEMNRLRDEHNSLRT